MKPRALVLKFGLKMNALQCLNIGLMVTKMVVWGFIPEGHNQRKISQNLISITVLFLEEFSVIKWFAKQEQPYFLSLSHKHTILWDTGSLSPCARQCYVLCFWWLCFVYIDRQAWQIERQLHIIMLNTYF